MVRTGHYTIAGAFVGLIGLLLVAGASAAGDNLPTKGKPSSMTEQEMQQVVDRNETNNVGYLAAFKRNNVDPSALKVGRIHTAGVGPATLQGTHNVPLVIYGHVDRIEFVSDSNSPGTLPIARSTVSVTKVLAARGVPAPAPISRITVLQYGGPVWQQGADLVHGTGGMLAELETDPLLVPGRDVVLFLQHPRTITPVWTQDAWMSAVGPSLDLRNGVVTHTEAQFANEVIGKSVEELEQTVNSET